MSTPKSALVGYIGKKIRKLREEKGYTQDEFDLAPTSRTPH